MCVSLQDVGYRILKIIMFVALLDIKYNTGIKEKLTTSGH